MPETVTAPAAPLTSATTVKPPPGGSPGREVTPPASAPGNFPDAFADIDATAGAPALPPRTARERTAARIAAADKPAAPTPAPAPAAPATKPPETPAKAVEPPPAAAPAAAKPADAPTATPAEPAKPPLPTDEDLEALRHTAGFHVAKDLRRELYRVRKLVDERDAKLREIEARAGKPPESDAKLKEAQERLAAHEKRLAEYETELRHANYTRSAEYREKYETPYKEEYAEAVDLMSQLEVELPDGSTRAATEKDLQDMLALSEGMAARESKKFGAADSLVMRRYEALRKISREAQRAVERYKKEGGEREAARAAEAQRTRETLDRAWQDATRDVVERHKDWFGTRENDNDWNDRLQKGFDEVDRANNPDLPVQERIARQAAVRARAAAFGPLLRERDALKTRIAELEADLAEYEKSVPGSGSKTGGGEPPKPHDETADEMIDAMARGA